jgi:hypothetical protein
MGNAHYPKVDLSKYFNHKQKVFLINVSENRDQELYESLSGAIVGRTRNSIALQIPYPTEYTSPANESRKHTFKLTSEAMGNGIQAIADLIRVESGNIFHLRLLSNIEMYQRRQVPRIDTTIKLFQIQRNSSLDVYRKEFLRIRAQIMSQGVPTNLAMQDAAINLGVGGIRVECEARVNPSLLSMFFIGLNDNEIPVYALGDLVWSRLENDMRMCGYRFIQISKTDQERINSYIQLLRKKQKIAVPLSRTNWELLDRMMCDMAFV